MTRIGHVYRSDIDGLRAIAVAAVVLFHAGVPGFGGGFAGVDVFFVISGFLITSIIMDGIVEDRFSIVRFYERRIRRIFPALFAMLGLSCIAASILFLPANFVDFTNSLVAATLFASNVFFWQTSDYFSGPAHLKPLLHTWSLAVEEQFYIVYPILLVAIHRWSRGAFRSWLLLFFFVSLAISVWSMTEKPVAGFYLAPPRAWELLLGSLLALGVPPVASSHLVREALGALGLLLIAWTVATYSTVTPFPGTSALAPCVGAGLLIYSGQGAPTYAGRLLRLRPLVFLGLVSYSLYLWHWPVLVFARYWNASPLSVPQIAGLLLISLGLAIASWKYIEQPFRSGYWLMPRRALFGAAAAVMAGAVVFGVLARESKGWPGRFENYHRPLIAGEKALKTRRCFLHPDQGPWNYAGLENCGGGIETARSVLVWGNSFGAHLVPGLSVLAGTDMAIVEYAAAGCPPVLGLDVAGRPHCRAFNDHALRVIEDLAPDVVVLAARWEAYLARLRGMEALQATVDELSELGIKVVIVGQSPCFDFTNPYDFVYQKEVSTARVNFGNEVNEALAAVRNVSFFDPMALLCSGLTCPLREGKNYLYFDDAHFSSAGSAKVASALLPFLARTIIATVPGTSGRDTRASAVP